MLKQPAAPQAKQSNRLLNGETLTIITALTATGQPIVSVESKEIHLQNVYYENGQYPKRQTTVTAGFL